MPSIDGASLNVLISTPLLGALAALIIVLLAFMRRGVARRMVLPAAVMVIFSLGVTATLEHMAEVERSAERGALAQRSVQLTGQALAPGSTLACLDGGAVEAVEKACEKTVFADPQSTAAAVAYMAARLTLLADGQAFAHRSDRGFAATLAGLRRAIELDRFGIAAHVLAVRDDCTAERCDAFTLLVHPKVIKSDLKAQLFDQYVSRYAASWNKSYRTAPVAILRKAPAKTTASDKYDPPSSASIPPVSIMNSEPPPRSRR